MHFTIIAPIESVHTEKKPDTAIRSSLKKHRNLNANSSPSSALFSFAIRPTYFIFICIRALSQECLASETLLQRNVEAPRRRGAGEGRHFSTIFIRRTVFGLRVDYGVAAINTQITQVNVYRCRIKHSKAVQGVVDIRPR